MKTKTIDIDETFKHLNKKVEAKRRYIRYIWNHKPFHSFIHLLLHHKLASHKTHNEMI